MTRGQIAYTGADDAEAIFGLGIAETQVDQMATQAELDALTAIAATSTAADAYIPYVIDQTTDVVQDSDSSAGGNGLGATLTATNLIAPVAASTLYAVEATLFCTATGNSGVKVSFTGPASATLAWTWLHFDADDSFDRPGENAIADSEGLTVAQTFDLVLIKGLLTVSTTAGNLTLLFAQNAAHADNSVLHGESFLSVTKLH